MPLSRFINVANMSFEKLFAKIISSRNGGINLSFIDIGKSCPYREFLKSQICLSTLFAKNKILAKISEFTVDTMTLFEPRHEISNNVVCATSKASDQPAHTHSLIRAFSSGMNILGLSRYRLIYHLEFQSLKGGCKGSYESTLVKMPHCWKSHVAAHLVVSNFMERSLVNKGLTPLNTQIPIRQTNGETF